MCDLGGQVYVGADKMQVASADDALVVSQLTNPADGLTVFAVVLATMASEMRTLIDKYIGSSSECADDTFRSTGLMVIGTAR